MFELFTGEKAFDPKVSTAELKRLRSESRPVTPSSLVDTLDPAVERAILRCLEREPADRPPSALAVSAALPGGDPLAAALAAGETPSPELVAAAVFIPGLLGEEAVVSSRCPTSGETVRVTVTPDGVENFSPSDAVVSVVLPDGGHSPAQIGPASPT